MNNPQLSEVEFGKPEETMPLYEMRKADRRSLVGLYFSQVLLYVGFLLILLNNLGILEPDSYFGAMNWLTIAVFSIGVIINFFSIPWLYLSSFKNFKNENDFWDKEIFWVLPLFFFGTFFLYESRVNNSFFFFIMSLLVIAIVHVFSSYCAYKIKQKHKHDLERHYQYSMSLKYLSAYYVLLVVLLIFHNPLQHMFTWIRTNI